jgi:mono/diheme cytochrome c family protein
MTKNELNLKRWSKNRVMAGRWTLVCCAVAFWLGGPSRSGGQTNGNASPPKSVTAAAQSKQPAKPNKGSKAANGVRLIDSIQGPDLFKAYCASCHGGNAKGGGPMAASLKTKPADLTRISERNGGTFPFARIQRIISGEQQLPSGHGSREMPVWGPIFSQVTRNDMDLGRVRIDNLTRYLRDIQPMEEVR